MLFAAVAVLLAAGATGLLPPAPRARPLSTVVRGDSGGQPPEEVSPLTWLFQRATHDIGWLNRFADEDAAAPPPADAAASDFDNDAALLRLFTADRQARERARRDLRVVRVRSERDLALLNDVVELERKVARSIGIASEPEPDDNDDADADDDAAPQRRPPSVGSIRVCVSNAACKHNGGPELITSLKALGHASGAAPGSYEVGACACTGACPKDRRSVVVRECAAATSTTTRTPNASALQLLRLLLLLILLRAARYFHHY